MYKTGEKIFQVRPGYIEEDFNFLKSFGHTPPSVDQPVFCFIKCESTLVAYVELDIQCDSLVFFSRA